MSDQQKMFEALSFIVELTDEALRTANIGTGEEVALRHANKRATEALAAASFSPGEMERRCAEEIATNWKPFCTDCQPSDDASESRRENREMASLVISRYGRALHAEVVRLARCRLVEKVAADLLAENLLLLVEQRTKLLGLCREFVAIWQNADSGKLEDAVHGLVADMRLAVSQFGDVDIAGILSKREGA